MILGVNKIFGIDITQYPTLSAGGRLTRLDRFPKSNLAKESATASVFLEIDANGQVEFQFFPMARVSQYHGMRGHPIEGFDPLLLDGTVEARWLLSPSNTEQLINFDDLPLIDGKGEVVIYRFTNTSSQVQTIRLDDFFAFDDIGLGRNIDRGFQIRERSLSTIKTNDFGVQSLTERNSIKQIQANIGLLTAEQIEKLEDLARDRQGKPFVIFLDEQKKLGRKLKDLGGKFYFSDDLGTRHNFAKIWRTSIKLRELV